MSALLRSGPLRATSCTAPGRLDFLGGVADYSGSLVLEMPTQVHTLATLAPGKGLAARFSSPDFGTAELDLAPLKALLQQGAPVAEFRRHLETIEFPRWARYPLGCLIVLARHARWFPGSGFSLQIRSTVPEGQGVSSSAALEIATLRAFTQAADLQLSDLELARMGQQAENLIVGASCGLMDQLASSCGKPGELLPILCRPDVLHDPLPLPAGLIIAGWPSGVKHHVDASPYATARAAAFMGKRILERLSGQRWKHAAEIPRDLFFRHESTLPESMAGADYLAVYDDTDDPLTELDPGHVYPVRAALRFPIEENARARRACAILSAYVSGDISMASELRAILKASHEGYTAMGLGSPQTDAILECILAEPPESGLIGGRISGGGSGGTVVVLHERRSMDRLRALAADSFSGALIF